MTPVAYLADIRKDGPSDFLVSFRAIPEAIAQGNSLNEAYANAHDALAVALETYLELGREIPAPDVGLGAAPENGPYHVSVRPKLAARIRLKSLMRDQNISNVRLAGLWGKDEKAVRMVLSGKGASLDMTLDALRAVGVQPALAI